MWMLKCADFERCGAGREAGEGRPGEVPHPDEEAAGGCEAAGCCREAAEQLGSRPPAQHQARVASFVLKHAYGQDCCVALARN